jgi:hypothetical protein
MLSQKANANLQAKEATSEEMPTIDQEIATSEGSEGKPLQEGRPIDKRIIILLAIVAILLVCMCLVICLLQPKKSNCRSLPNLLQHEEDDEEESLME